ncbi:hypothetical protein R6Q59_014744 [Mikania micrantha]
MWGTSASSVRFLLVTTAFKEPSLMKLAVFQGYVSFICTKTNSRIDLSYNKLVGSIPKEIGFLSKLTGVALDNNNLTGGIPPFLGNLTSLEMLSVKKNPFGGSIPHIVGHLKSLKQLYFGGCSLS